MRPISKDAWHRRLYVQAYIVDRSWLDYDVPLTPKDLPEHDAFEKAKLALTEYLMANPEAPNDGPWKAMHDAQKAVFKAEEAWYAGKRAELHAERSEKNRTRLAEGRLSLCPYFWSVVIAVIWYSLVVRTVQRIGKFFGAAKSQIELGVRVTGKVLKFASIALVLGLVGYGLYAVGPKVPRIPGYVAGEVREWREERAARKAREAAAAAAAAQREAERLAWEKEHPEEVRRRAEYDAYVKAQRERYEAMEKAESERRSAERWERDKQALKEGGGLLVLMLGGCVLFIGGILVFGDRFSKYWETKGKARWQATAFYRWYAGRVEAFDRFLCETWELLVAFLKAKKERVCPYLEFEDGETQR